MIADLETLRDLLERVRGVWKRRQERKRFGRLWAEYEPSAEFYQRQAWVEEGDRQFAERALITKAERTRKALSELAEGDAELL